MTVVDPEVALFRWLIGNRKAVDLDGPKAANRFTQQDKTTVLVSTPVVGWQYTKSYKILGLEVKNGKRTVVLHIKAGINCSIKGVGAEGKFAQIIPEADLNLGEYAFINTDITVQPSVLSYKFIDEFWHLSDR
jgi:hypothetical protein